MILGYFALFLKTTYYGVWEARFWHMPWSDSTPIGPGEPGRRSAPFVGQPCPFVVGESVLRWGVATKALEKQETPATARIEVIISELVHGTVVLRNKSSTGSVVHQAATQ